MDTIDLNEIGIKEKIKAEVERFKKFQQSVLGIKAKVHVKDIDIRNYAKYLLCEGMPVEKRELMSCFKSSIFLKEKLVTLSDESVVIQMQQGLC